MAALRDALAGRVDNVLVFLGLSLFMVALSLQVRVLIPVAFVLFLAGIFLADVVEDLLVAADDGDDAADPLADLREQYARGELDHEEFEARVDRLLATDLDDADRPTADAGQRVPGADERTSDRRTPDPAEE